MNKDRQLDDFFGLPSLSETDEENPSVKSPKQSGIRSDVINNKNKSLKTKLRFLPKVLSKKERYLIFVFLIVILGSLISIPVLSYYHFTTPIADYGGTINEGIIGEPRHINPLLSQSDADRDLVRLIYSGLLKYNEDGLLIPDIARSYEISPDELNYTVYLKEAVKWHDGLPVTADDILFTIQTAQNTDYGSFQRINWQGVELEKVNDLTIVFKLKNKYAQFLNNLTLPIMPRHLWENIKPINFGLSEFNIKPTGSGPYKFEKLQKDKSGRIIQYELSSNEDYYFQRPFINEMVIRFYESEDSLVNAYNNNEVQNLGFISSNSIKDLKYRQRLEIEKIKMPRYFGVFFNKNQSEILSEKNIRLALAHATDKKTLIDTLLGGNGISIESPMLGKILEVNEDVKIYEYDPVLALEFLQEEGWTEKNENGFLVNDSDEELKIKLTTSTWPELIAVAQNLEKQWEKLGINTEIEALPTSLLQQVIKERNYQMLLFGEILNIDPDPFSLWHSSQKRDPGLNLALYENKDADTLLEEARKTLNPTERIEKYNEFQDLVINDLPALFLYSPFYLYGHSTRIDGFANNIIATPSDRFLNIEKWFIKTHRIWK